MRIVQAILVLYLMSGCAIRQEDDGHTVFVGLGNTNQSQVGLHGAVRQRTEILGIWVDLDATDAFQSAGFGLRRSQTIRIGAKECRVVFFVDGKHLSDVDRVLLKQMNSEEFNPCIFDD